MDFLFNEITEYLAGKRTYKQAVDFYGMHGSNSALKTVFSLGEDAYSVKKLKEEFTKMLPQKLEISKTESFVSHSEPKKKGKINVEALPSHLKTEFYKLAPIIREIAATNPTLIHLKSNEARYESACRILELVEKRRAIFERLDYFQEHGLEHPFYLEKEISVIDNENYKIVNKSIEAKAHKTGDNVFYEAQYKLKLARSMRSKLKNKPNRHTDYKKVCEEITALELLIKNK